MRNVRIRRLHVKHFRSIAEETVSLGDLTIMVGQNATGKSNVVDAIRFMRDAMADGLDQAVAVRNGIRVVRQASPSRKPFNVELRVDYDVPVRTDMEVRVLPCSYGFKLGSSNDELVVLEEGGDLVESELMFESDGEFVFEDASTHKFERGRTGVVKVDGEELIGLASIDELAFSKPSRVPLSTGSKHYWSTFNVHDVLLRDSRFASIYPNVMRAPSPSQAATTLTEDCKNWASVIRAMRKNEEGQEALSKVIGLTRHVLPQLEDVTVKSIGGFLVPHFRFARGAGMRDMDLIPYQLSDGTLRLFGLLLALYQSPPATFLAVEEPEQMVHPGALRVLADAFNEAKERTQLLITTHSPYLLELFDVESIRVVSQDESGTTVGPVSTRQLQLVRDRLMTLPEIMVMDGLEAD